MGRFRRNPGRDRLACPDQTHSGTSDMPGSRFRGRAKAENRRARGLRRAFRARLRTPGERVLPLLLGSISASTSPPSSQRHYHAFCVCLFLRGIPRTLAHGRALGQVLPTPEVKCPGSGEQELPQGDDPVRSCYHHTSEGFRLTSDSRAGVMPEMAAHILLREEPGQPRQYRLSEPADIQHRHPF